MVISVLRHYRKLQYNGVSSWHWNAVLRLPSTSHLSTSHLARLRCSFFEGRIVQSGYATCHFLEYQKHNLLYITGFQRKMGSHNDLRDIKNAKCCQPPDLHKSKPHTCTSADWDLSFSRYVAQKTPFFIIVFSSLLRINCHFFPEVTVQERYIVLQKQRLYT